MRTLLFKLEQPWGCIPRFNKTVVNISFSCKLDQIFFIFKLSALDIKCKTKKCIKKKFRLKCIREKYLVQPC